MTSARSADPRADGLRPPVPALAGKRILVVDDVELVARTTALLLETLGARAATATSAAEARARVEADTWELVLLDLEIPGVVGTALLEELRRRRPTLPIVVVSGHPDEAAGPLDARTRFLQKPFGLDQLLTAVEAAVATAPLTPPP